MNVGVGGIISQRGRRHLEVRALDGVSLELRKGDRLGIIGRNGAGKSTLLRLLAGLREPTAGSVEVSGKTAALLNIASILDPEMTGHENIARALVLLGIPSRDHAVLSKDIDDFTELGPYLDLPVKVYSAGMQLRLSFSLMTAQRPEILLLDETLSAGDNQFHARANARMDELRGRTDIVVLASHVESEIRKICNKVLWLEQGRCRLFGDTESVLAAYGQAKQH
jgi:ABC-2 type transport system ATP-binding protein/lipopolysaccharide transport system ATP-binding protein